MIVFIKTKSEVDPLKNLTILTINYAGYMINDMVGLKSGNNLFEFAILRSKYMEKENAVHDIDIFSCNNDKKLVHRSEKLVIKAELISPVEPIGILAVSKQSIVYKSLDSSKLHLKKEIKVFENEEYFLSVKPFKKQLHLAQSSKGKVCLIRVISEQKEISVLCVDVLPVARSWCIMNETYLFLSSQISDHFLYCLNFSSFEEDFILKSKKEQIFEPVLMLPNYSPVLDFQIGDLEKKGFSQIYIAGGKSDQSHLRVLELGCKIERDELYWSIDIDEELYTVWICKWKTEDNLLTEDEILLIVSGVTTTNVFILNCSKKLKEVSSKEILPLEDCVEQFPFYTDDCTLCCVQLGDLILQITPNKILLIQKNDIIYCAEQDTKIKVCAVNQLNAAIYSDDGLTDGFLEYIWFGCEEKEDCPYERYCSFFFPPTLLAIGKVREENKSPLIAAVDSENTVRIVYFEFKPEVDLKEMKGRKFVQKVTSIEILTVKPSKSAGDHEDSMNCFSTGYEEYLLVGLEDGCLFKYKLNGYECIIDDDEYRLALACCIKMLKVALWDQEAVIIKSEKEKQYIFCYYQGLFQLFPLLTDFMYDYFWPFSQGILGYRDGQADFLTLPTFGYMYAQSKVKLECTPCKVILDEFWKKIIVLERGKKIFPSRKDDVNKGHLTAFITDDNEEKSFVEFGTKNKSWWFSQIEIIDPFDLRKKDLVPLEENAYAMSLCTINTSPRCGFLIVGTLLKFEETKKRSGIPTALIYEISYDFEDALSIKLIGKTALEDLPSTMCVFKEKILIAEGIYLGLYKLYKRQLTLISKKKMADKISSISTNPKHNVIFVGFVKGSVSIFRLFGEELHLFAEERTVVPTTSVACLNKDTFALVDSFGNLIMMTLESIYPIVKSLKSCTENFQLVIRSKCNVGKIVKIQLKQLHENARPCLVYMTHSGSIGVLFENNRNSKSFLSSLQKHMIGNTVHSSNMCLNQEKQCLVDGDLCLEYLTAPKDLKNAIANDMKTSPKFISDCLHHMKLIHYIWKM